MPDGVNARQAHGKKWRRLRVKRVEQLQMHPIGQYRRAIGAHVVIVLRLRRAHGRDQRDRVGHGRCLQRYTRIGEELGRPYRRCGVKIHLRL